MGSGEKTRSQGLVAQWITRLTTDQKIPGSNPGKVEFFFISFFTFIPAQKKKIWPVWGSNPRPSRY